MPSALLATPRPQRPAEKEGCPNWQPEAEGDDGENEMEPVRQRRVDEGLLAPAMGTERSDSVTVLAGRFYIFHLAFMP